MRQKIQHKKRRYHRSSSGIYLRIQSYINQLENFRTYLLTQPLFLIVTRWQKPPLAKRYSITFLIVFIVSLIRVFLNLSLEQNLSYLIFTFAVVFSAWYGGLGTGLFATALCILSGMYFSAEPTAAISLKTGPEQIRVGLFILQGSIISLLSESVQAATRWQSIILESISDVFITYDRNMRFMYVNSKAEEMLDAPRNLLIGRRLTDLYPDARKTLFYKHCLESLKTQKTKLFEFNTPGGERWYDVSLYPSNDGISAYYQDITKRKRVEKRLRESQLQFKRFVDANIIGVVVEDLRGSIYEANDAFLSMVGYTRTDLRNGLINWQHMTPIEYQKLDEEMNGKLVKKGMVHPYSKEYIRKDGKRIHVLIGAVMLSKSSQKAITFYLDITEQKELDKKKNEFISIASHELKTPLTSVKVFTQILMKQYENTKDKRSLYFMTNINNQLDKLNELVSDLLDVSKIEEGRLNIQKKMFSIDALVKKTVVDFHYISQGHTVIKKGESTLFVKGDEHRLGQVLINLISNAIKYSPAADKVIVTIKDVKNKVEIHVQDFGEGIPLEDREKIFTRFFRSNQHEASRISGFGLGLYISKEIVTSHNGKIHVISEEKKGSTFTVTLPAQRTIIERVSKKAEMESTL